MPSKTKTILSDFEMKGPKFKMPSFSKKIGMNLGIEYLVRSGIIRDFMKFPCSIFVKSGESKVVITINKANIQNDDHAILYCVRNWFISDCDEGQPIPSMEETIVKDVDLFHSPQVILKGYSPLYFDCNSIEWKRNIGNNGHPMPDYIYEDYFHKMLSPVSHKAKKEDFLWNSFTTVYIPSIRHMAQEEYSISNFSIGHSQKSAIIFSKQQILIEKNFKTTWMAWLKWKRFMIFDTVPGELIFMRDYSAKD